MSERSAAASTEADSRSGEHPDLDGASAEEILVYAAGRFPRLALACSFQKEESVLVHLLARVAPQTAVFTLDTHVLFPETRATWQAFEERFGVVIDAVDVLPAPDERPDGEPAWTAARCCTARKVAAVRERLSGLDAWITGVRREQAATRAESHALEWDSRHDLWKVNPLVGWTEAEVWRYALDNKLPYNALHDRGYASIGCAPCTRPGTGREGRWAGLGKTECGLHADG